MTDFIFEGLSSKTLVSCFCVGLGLLACFPMMVQVLISLSWPRKTRGEAEDPLSKRGFLQEHLISLMLALYFILVVSVSACVVEVIRKMSE